MNIEQFCKEQQGLILAFKMAWTKAAHQRPDMFPTEMDAGEWDEALLGFDGTDFDPGTEEGTDFVNTPLQ